jgi:quinol monooxygenase YgiN
MRPIRPRSSDGSNVQPRRDAKASGCLWIEKARISCRRRLARTWVGNAVIPLLAFSVPVLAGPGASGPHAIIHVDVMPNEESRGTKLLLNYVAKARKDTDLRAIVLIRQAGASNHFIIDESFVSKPAYLHFVQNAYVRAFRSSLQPLLGSPWDERLGTDITS